MIPARIAPAGRWEAALADDGSGACWDDLLTPAETARLLRNSVKTLERWRSQGVGPPYVKQHGFKIGYRRSDLAAYLAACVVRPDGWSNGDNFLCQCSHLAHTAGSISEEGEPLSTESDSVSEG
jgi:hypothetical protein